VGAGDLIELDVVEHTLEPGDVALLCSDGLHGMIGDETISRLVAPAPDSLEEAAARLIEAANEAGGRDNVTVVLLRYANDWGRDRPIALTPLRGGPTIAPVSGPWSAPVMRLVDRDKRVGLHLPVEVRGEDAAGRPFTELTRTVNVSGGGILFESRRPVAVGSRLTLSIELPPSLRHRFGDRDVYRARAVVCRVEQREDQGWRVGARFLSETPADGVL
jgi:PilZ domain